MPQRSCSPANVDLVEVIRSHHFVHYFVAYNDEFE
jgi:hypothetical protein